MTEVRGATSTATETAPSAFSFASGREIRIEVKPIMVRRLSSPLPGRRVWRPSAMVAISVRLPPGARAYSLSAEGAGRASCRQKLLKWPLQLPSWHCSGVGRPLLATSPRIWEAAWLSGAATAPKAMKAKPSEDGGEKGMTRQCDEALGDEAQASVDTPLGYAGGLGSAASDWSSKAQRGPTVPLQLFRAPISVTRRPIRKLLTPGARRSTRPGTRDRERRACADGLWRGKGKPCRDPARWRDERLPIIRG